MEEFLRRAGVTRMALSSNPQIEAFLLEDDNARYLVASAYRGLNRLRKLKKRETYENHITLHDFPDTLWNVSRLYPGPKKTTVRSTADLQSNGFHIQMMDANLRIYKLEPLKNRRTP